MRTYLGDALLVNGDVAVVGGPAEVASLTEPIISSHRSSEVLYPEHSPHGLNRELRDFAQSDASFTLEADFQHLSGSGVALIHDGNLDRTTDTSGSVAATTAAALAAVRIDQYPSLPLSDDGRRVLTGAEFFERYASRWATTIEPKTATAATRTLALIQAYGLTDNVFINAATITLLQPFINVDMPTLLLTPAETPAEIVAAGVTHVGWGSGPDPELQATIDAIAPYLAVGLKVWLSSSSRHQWSVFRQTGGHSGGFCSDPLWISGDADRGLTDAFASKAFQSGHHPYVAHEPGHFVDLPGVTGWAPTADTDGWTMFGWLELPGSTLTDWDHRAGTWTTVAADYPIGFEADVTYLSAGATPTRRVGFALTDDDQGYNDTVTSGARQGLFFHLAPDGTLSIGERNAAAETVLGTLATAAISVDQKVRLRVERVSATQARLTRLDTADALTVTTTDDMGAAGYVHAGNPGVTSSTGRWAFSAVAAL